MDRNQALALYRQMLLIRRFEERCAQLYVEGKIGGFLHLYIGQEAVGVGAISLLRPDDYFDRPPTATTATRWPAAPIPRLLMAELCGKATGISRGKGGACTSTTCPPATSAATASWAATFRIAAGMGYGIRLRGTDQVCSASSATAPSTRAPSTKR